MINVGGWVNNYLYNVSIIVFVSFENENKETLRLYFHDIWDKSRIFPSIILLLLNNMLCLLMLVWIRGYRPFLRYGGRDRSVLLGLGVYRQVYPNGIVL